jgi:hypothetical protein
VADGPSSPTSWAEPRKPKRWPVIVGAIVTVAWVAFLVIYLLTVADVFADLPPNEFGDFLAGAFAPLAFLWLVLGFWQQGQELRHSADALWLQGKELQHSVEQQRELVNVSREQLQFESHVLQQQREEIARSAQPILSIVRAGSMSSPPGNRLYRFRVINYGKTCTEVRLDIKGYRSSPAAPAIKTGEPFEFNIEAPIENRLPYDVDIYFKDERLIPGVRRFRIVPDEAGFIVVDLDADKIAA